MDCFGDVAPFGLSETYRRFRGAYYLRRQGLDSNILFSLLFGIELKKDKAVPLHALKALGTRGCIAPTHSPPRH
jgi:hypothetical protein